MLRRYCQNICVLQPAAQRLLLSCKSTGYSTTTFQRKFASFSLNRLARFRDQVRAATKRRPLAELQKESGPKLEFADSIPVRSGTHLWRALGFTVGVSAVVYTVTAVVESLKEIQEHHRLQDTFQDLTLPIPDLFTSEEEQSPIPIEVKQLTDGQKTILAIIGLNALVFLVWRIPQTKAFMYRWFTNSFASKSLCSPMLLSVFSHYSFLHLAVNMYVLYSFAPIAVERFLGVEQFIAFFTTAGVLSSFTSLVQKYAVRSNVRALGASGAICAILAYTCMRIPEARLSIIFMPFFTFSAEEAIYGLIAIDLLGLLFRFRLFDHAAHLGGSLFGLFYATYGEDWVRKHFHPFITRVCEWYFAA
ncbi:Peptidase, S54 family [Aphelenchoides besseyi]|nr:Peptidase, S54 family [Aphelenchoides besseyi]